MDELFQFSFVLLIIGVSCYRMMCTKHTCLNLPAMEIIAVFCIFGKC